MTRGFRALLVALLGLGAAPACAKAVPTLAEQSEQTACAVSIPAPATSRPVKSLGSELRVAWTRRIQDAPLQHPLAASETRVAASVASTLVVLNADGTPIGEVRGTEGRRLSAPAIDREDNVYVADELALRSFDPGLSERWNRPLDAANTTEEFVAPQAPRLTADGAALLLGLDGTLCRFDAARGDGRECAPIPAGARVKAFGPAMPAGRYVAVEDDGSGSRYSVLLTTGPARSQGVTTDDGRRWLITHASSGLGLVGTHVSESGRRMEVTVFDACGTPRWKVPGDRARPAGVAFGAELVVIDTLTNDASDSRYRLRRFSSNGALLATSAELDPSHVVGLGSDDTLYLLSCRPKGESRAELIGLGADLTVRWSLLADSKDCPPGAVLAPNGTVYLTRHARVGGAHELVAIRTPSPGSAAMIFAAAPGDVRL
jgi:hypothetical protein